MAKQRGRNLLKKQQKDQFEPFKHGDEHDGDGEYPVSIKLSDVNDNSICQPNTFFGTLQTDELEYFKKAESTLKIDTFETADEKYQFVNSVIEESKGKELKLATSQICSKLMERIILESDEKQLKSIFRTFNGFFINVSCHKYASHVLETLLVRSAALVEKELLTPTFEDAIPEQEDGIYASMENLFLFMLNEFKPHFKMMVNHQYASHVLRLLILILSSKTLPSSTKTNSTLRSKKSKIARKMIDLKDNDDFNKVYRTPDSFKTELKDILSSLYKDFSGGVEQGSKNLSKISPSHITKMREYCVDKVASPVIQLILQVEGIFDRDRSFWSLIFSDSTEKDAKEEAFIEYLLSDSVGSHFLQNIVGFTKVKYAERLYRLYMQDRIVKLAKRDSTAAFVVQALLKNLHQNEVRRILNDLTPELDILLNSNVDFGIEIIDASIRQGNFKREEIVEKLKQKFYPEASETKNILESCLLLSSSTLGNTRDDWPTAEERRRALFLEKLIDYDDQFLGITIDSLLDLPEERCLMMCYHGVFSYVVQHVLQVKRVDIIKRKLLLNVLCKDVVNLSCNAYGSHLMDKLWEFTAKLALYKERIAEALTVEATKVKNNVYGRQVWKNWNLELYVRKRFDWKKKVREQDSELFPDSKPLQPKSTTSSTADYKKRGAPNGSDRYQEDKKFKKKNFGTQRR
ncbi:RNA-binding RNA processing protein NOP9 Ecym_8254 [Eremothecium cymbalariae DBVPG|uniref:Nucleolar protein 9 n=1 Tax=Eremothecium cymbalariae (strain CBS 270.75 / DBVPG 7215 / KCTC 17166 / NRRL Y-17582) TaxID=931890 RepID=G8JXG3_ERECY|nr:Hypothetical protein Ecym_8254 [Eremothecium cymbalariae DBVPG\